MKTIGPKRWMSLGAAAIVAAGLVTVCAPASAAPLQPASPGITPVLTGDLGHFNANYVNIRSSPSTHSAHIYGQGQRGQNYCFDGYVYSNSWLYGTDGQTSRTGYVQESYISYTEGSYCHAA